MAITLISPIALAHRLRRLNHHMVSVHIYMYKPGNPLRLQSRSSLERLLEIGNNIIDVFRSNGDPNPIFRRARVQTLLLG